MISHELNCIFIHIPKCGGTSIKYFLFPDEYVHWFEPDYEKLHGWCPERKFFMQHASARQLLETGLVSRKTWDSYYKFTFVRNPWDRAVSDYFWMCKDRNIKDSFDNYLNRSGKFEKILRQEGSIDYRGDHLRPQSAYFGSEGLELDFVGRFEHYQADMGLVCKAIAPNRVFDQARNVRKGKKRHYSTYYKDHQIELVAKMYKDDIVQFDYQFEDRRPSWQKWFS